MNEGLDIRNLPELCGDHVRRLGEIYRSNLTELDKERAFEAGLRETSDCRNCLVRRRGKYLPRRMKVKICVVGDNSAEKAALLAPFVHPMFDERYIRTFGTQVSKKELLAADPSGSGEIQVDLTVWNIMGSKGFRDLLKEAYFYGVRGILAVCDVTRKKTLDDLDDWIEGVYSVTGKIPVVLLGNKIEFKDQIQVREDDLAQAAKAYGCPYFFTSTRTGLNVEKAFRTLAERVARERYARKLVPEE